MPRHSVTVFEQRSVVEASKEKAQAPCKHVNYALVCSIGKERRESRLLMCIIARKSQLQFALKARNKGVITRRIFPRHD